MDIVTFQRGDKTALTKNFSLYEFECPCGCTAQMIDKELVHQAIICDMALSEAMTKRAYELTGLENPNSVQQMKTCLSERGLERSSCRGEF